MLLSLLFFRNGGRKMSNKNNFRPKVTIGTAPAQETVAEDTTAKAEEREFSDKESANQLRMAEDDFIQGLIDATAYVKEEKKTIEIARKDPRTGKSRVCFKFTVRPLSEKEYDKCKRNNTKYIRNKSLGIHMPENTDSVKYRDQIIYEATIPEDRERLWDNRKVWDSLRNQGLQIMNGLDVIEYALKAGEKEAIIDKIDKLSAFEDNLEEVIKN